MFLLLCRKGSGEDGGMERGGEGDYKLADVNGTFPTLY